MARLDGRQSGFAADVRIARRVLSDGPATGRPILIGSAGGELHFEMAKCLERQAGFKKRREQERGQLCPREFKREARTRGQGCPRSFPESVLLERFVLLCERLGGGILT